MRGRVGEGGEALAGRWKVMEVQPGKNESSLGGNSMSGSVAWRKVDQLHTLAARSSEAFRVSQLTYLLRLRVQIVSW